MPKKEEVTEDILKDKTQEEKNEAALSALKGQIEEFIKQADHYKTLATKAQGAIEVLEQVTPNKDNNEG